MSRGFLKILMLTQFLDPTRGGGESIIYQIANKLSKRGHKISIIKHKITGGRYAYNNNIQVIEISPAIEHKGQLPASFLQNFLYIINCVRSGLKIIKNEKTHIIHANNYTPVFAGWLISKLTRRPMVVTIHDVASLHGIDFWRKWMGQFGKLSYLKSLIGYVTELLTLWLAENIHTVSTTSKKDILTLFPQKKNNLWIISNGLDLEHYRVLDDEIKYGNEMTFIGRLVFYKNLDVVLKALSLIPENVNFKLTILGNGPMRQEWEKLSAKWGVSEKVSFLGYVSHEQKVRVLRRISALVLPSFFEGFGIVILEAWAFKKPVIVADVSPLNEIVEHGRDGFVADPYNPEEWAKYVKLLLENKDLAQKMGENGYEKLINHYTIEKTVDKLERLYKQIIFTKELSIH